MDGMEVKNMPRAWRLVDMLGPSLIVLGVGLGSGELIMWPYLTANFGLGLVWAAILGISAQFVVNMEIERYALVTGESVFVGWARRFGNWIAWWFCASTLLPWIWPGIAAAAATVFAKALGIHYSSVVGVVVLVAIGMVYSTGKIVYKTQEWVQKVIIVIGVPFVIVLTGWVIYKIGDVKEILGMMYAGVGKIPTNIPLGAFLVALVYSGAGGNLNLAQSLYVKEKGYGMGKYSDKLHNLLAGNSQGQYRLAGQMFEMTQENLNNFKDWWRKINVEHFLVFWLTGVVTIGLNNNNRLVNLGYSRLSVQEIESPE